MGINAGPTIHSSNQNVNGIIMVRNIVVAHSLIVVGKGFALSLMLKFRSFAGFIASKRYKMSTILLSHHCR